MNMKKAVKTLLSLALILSLSTAALAAGTPVSYDLSQTVSTGTVRYVSQNNDSPYFYSDYWGDYADEAKHECMAAAVSMSLSYIGVDATPGEMLSAGQGTLRNAYSWGGSTYAETELAAAIDNFLYGGGSYSPPIIHLNNYSAGGHYVLLVAKTAENVYKAADPYTDELWDITIAGNAASYNFYGEKTDTVTTAMQYYKDNGAAVPVAGAKIVFTMGQTSYTYNGETRDFDAAPYAKSGYTYLPARAVAENLGAEVLWDSATKVVTVTKGNAVITFSQGSYVMMINGIPKTLEVPPEISNGRVCLPVRRVAEALGAQVTWNAEDKTVTITMD